MVLHRGRGACVGMAAFKAVAAPTHGIDVHRERAFTRSVDVIRHNPRYQRRYPRRRGRRTNLLRRVSDGIAIGAAIAASTAGSGHPIAEATMGILFVGGLILALLQYGRGYRRATWLLIAATLAGVMAGHALWPNT